MAASMATRVTASAVCLFMPGQAPPRALPDERPAPRAARPPERVADCADGDVNSSYRFPARLSPSTPRGRRSAGPGSRRGEGPVADEEDHEAGADRGGEDEEVGGGGDAVDVNEADGEEHEDGQRQDGAPLGRIDGRLAEEDAVAPRIEGGLEGDDGPLLRRRPGGAGEIGTEDPPHRLRQPGRRPVEVRPALGSPASPRSRRTGDRSGPRRPQPGGGRRAALGTGAWRSDRARLASDGLSASARFVQTWEATKAMTRPVTTPRAESIDGVVRWSRRRVMPRAGDPVDEDREEMAEDEDDQADRLRRTATRSRRSCACGVVGEGDLVGGGDVADRRFQGSSSHDPGAEATRRGVEPNAAARSRESGDQSAPTSLAPESSGFATVWRAGRPAARTGEPSPCRCVSTFSRRGPAAEFRRRLRAAPSRHHAISQEWNMRILLASLVLAASVAFGTASAPAQDAANAYDPAPGDGSSSTSTGSSRSRSGRPEDREGRLHRRPGVRRPDAQEPSSSTTTTR